MPKKTPDPMRLLVDPVACEAVGFCSYLAADVITLDRWGYPRVPVRPLSPEETRAAQHAMRACPHRALHLVDAPRP
jgi:ferredoxin